MALSQKQIDELKAHLAEAKRRDLAYGLCVGKKPADTIIYCDKKLKPDLLARKAKKAGDTAKVMQGYLSVKGVELVLQSEEPAPGGIIRTLKGFLSATSLKYKPRVVDPSGNVLGEEEEEESAQAIDAAPEAGADPDPLQAKWHSIYTRVEAALAKANPASENLTAAWVKVCAVADSGKYGAAIKASEKIIAALKSATQSGLDKPSAAQAAWEAASAKLKPQIEHAIAEGVGDAKRISAIWDLAQSKASSDTADYATALKTITPLTKLLSNMDDVVVAEQPASAGPGADETDKTKTPEKSDPLKPSSNEEAKAEKPDQSGVSSAEPLEAESETKKAEEIRHAEKIDAVQFLSAELDDLIVAFAGLIPGTAEKLPPNLEAIRKATAKSLSDLQRDPDKAKTKPIETLTLAMEKLGEAIRKLSAEKSSWKEALGAIQRRLILLERHPVAGMEPQVKPKIDAVKAEVAVLVAKADGYDFTGATAGSQSVCKTCDVIEALADDISHFRALFDLRNRIVDADRNKTTGVPDIDDLQTEMETLLKEAHADALAERVAEGLKKLAVIPEKFEIRTHLKARYRDYKIYFDKFQVKLDEIDKLPASVTAASKAEIDVLKKTFVNSSYASTQDYVKSANALALHFSALDSLLKMLHAKGAYETLLKAVEADLAICKQHQGRAALDDFQLIWTGDIDTAKSEANAEHYVAASRILEKNHQLWPLVKQKADECLRYQSRLERIQEDIAKYTGAAGAKANLEQVEAFVNAALLQAAKHEYALALKSLAEADNRLGYVQIAQLAQAELDKQPKSEALSKIETDFDAAMAVFTAIKDQVIATDKNKTLTDLIDQLDVPAGKAADEVAKAEPDFALARKHLEDAIAQAEDAMLKALAATPFQMNLALAEALVTNDLVPANDQNCIKPQIDRINERIADAKDLAKPGKYDFHGAELILAEVFRLGENAKADTQIWPVIKSNRAVIGNTIAGIAGTLARPEIKSLPELEAVFKVMETRYKGYFTDSHAKLAAAEFIPALEISSKAELEATVLKNDWNTIVSLVNNWNLLTKPQNSPHTISGTGVARIDACLARANTKNLELKAAITAENFDAALNLFNEIWWAVQEGHEINHQFERYKIARENAHKQLTALLKEKASLLNKSTTAIETEFKRHETAAASGEFIKTEAGMISLVTRCQNLIPKAKLAKKFETLQSDAKKGLAALTGHKAADRVNPLVLRLTGKLENAEKLADAENFGRANLLLTGFAAACADAVVEAEAIVNQERLGEGAVAEASASDIDTEEFKLAKAFLTTLESRANANVVLQGLKEAKQKIEQAESQSEDEPSARQALASAIKMLVEASQTLVQHAMFETETASVAPEIKDLKAHDQAAIIIKDIAEIEAKFTRAKEIAQSHGNLEQASTLAEDVFKALHAARKVADEYKKYVDLRAQPELEPRLEILERHAHRYKIKANIDTIREKLNHSAKAATARDHDTSMKLLSEVRALGVSSLVLADMRGDKVPDVKDVKAILDGPGGADELDAMIDGLELDVQRAVLRVAFEARFGCKLQNFSDEAMKTALADSSAVGYDIRRFYQVMSDLPQVDTTENDSLKLFTTIEDGGYGSMYQPAMKNIVMREGNALTSTAYHIGSAHELGDVEEDCQPAQDDPVLMFSWNTLHEVGHSVDDKLGYMRKNGAKSDHGGWKDIGYNAQEVGKIIGEFFKYDGEYLARYIAGNKNTVLPDSPESGKLSCSESEWESRRIQACQHIDLASIGNKPWNNAALCKRLAINGMVYHEAMTNMWVGYDIDARSKGITGYQFRAPGEWFSELYAAYYSEKLKPAHPAVKWLAKL